MEFLALAQIWNDFWHRTSEFAGTGGPIVAVLLLMSVAALMVALAKAAQFLWHGIGRRHSALERAVTNWRSARSGDALETANASRHPRARLIAQAMSAGQFGHDRDLAREEFESAALAYLGDLRAYLRVLEATAQVAPLIGLFGTVIGMMSAFQALQSAGAEADPAALAGGIWLALITTAVGLAVAIPANLALYWFEGRLAREQTLVETALTRILTAPDSSPIAALPRSTETPRLTDAAE